MSKKQKNVRWAMITISLLILISLFVHDNIKAKEYTFKTPHGAICFDLSDKVSAADLWQYDGLDELDKARKEAFELGRNYCKGFSPQKSVKPKTKIDEASRIYIKRFTKTAKAEQEKYGIPASIKMAQGMLESARGNSKLARDNNNHFGMKCFSKRCKKGHCSNYHDDGHKDFFRIYPSAWYSWRAHSKLLSGNNYKHLKKHGNDYKKWAYGLKKAGYATSPTYAEKLIKLIEKYNLDEL